MAYDDQPIEAALFSRGSLVRRAIEPHLTALVAQAIELALGGNERMLRWCLEQYAGKAVQQVNVNQSGTRPEFDIDALTNEERAALRTVIEARNRLTAQH